VPTSKEHDADNDDDDNDDDMMTATARADDDDDDDDGACRGRARRQQSLGNNLRVMERAEGVPVGNNPSATISV